jgi:tRNA pseudouridine38-40 synthase
MRYRLDIAYHGAHFHGWQRQPDLRTVQGELEDWITRLLGARDQIAVTGAGRTDAGVHATGMIAHFDVDSDLDCDPLCLRLNSALPADLLVNRIRPVEPEFHARYSATAREYEYRLTNQRSPFDRDRVWFSPGHLSPDELKAAASAVLGQHDFSGFCLAASRRESNLCNVTDSHWEIRDSLLIYHVRADRFLHMMVRLLVGTMVDIGRGRWSSNHLVEVLEAGDVRQCGEAAPPHGLTLTGITYPAHD